MICLVPLKVPSLGVTGLHRGGHGGRLLLLLLLDEVGLGADHDAELLVVDLAVAVLVDRLDHLVDLLVRHLARQVRQHELELVRRDAA